MFQRSITSKMRVKWVLNPKALTTNFPHAAHPVGVLLLAYSISPLFTCIPYLSKLQVINVIAINRQSRRERNCLHVLFAKVAHGSARNKMFDLSDLHKFMANKAGAFSLSLRRTHVS